MGYYENLDDELKWAHRDRAELEELAEDFIPPAEEYRKTLGYSETTAKKKRDRKLQENTECLVSLQASLRLCLKACIHPEAIEQLMEGYMDELKEKHRR